MSRTPLALAAGLTAAIVGFAIPAFAQSSGTTALKGTVGPGFTITLTKGGSKVTSLKAGTYRITVTDKASVHDFHLFGPGLNKVITSVPFKGTRTVTVKLRQGSYTYQCDPHAASGMKGSFKVTGGFAGGGTTTSDDSTNPTTTTTDDSTNTTTPSMGDDGNGYGYAARS
jgi:plastocyanin